MTGLRQALIGVADHQLDDGSWCFEDRATTRADQWHADYCVTARAALAAAPRECEWSNGICVTHCLHDGTEDASGCIHAEIAA